MSSCKNCLHYCLCKSNSEAYGMKLFKSKAEVKCSNFTDSSLFVNWHKIKIRELTTEEEEIFENEVAYTFDCEMPEHNQEILIATKYGTDMDTCYRDGCGLYLDKHDDFDGIIAWAELPEYKEQKKR